VPSERMAGLLPASFRVGDRLQVRVSPGDDHQDQAVAELDEAQVVRPSRRRASHATVVRVDQRGALVAIRRGPPGVVWHTEWSWGLEDPPSPGQPVLVRRVGRPGGLIGLTRRRAVCRTIPVGGEVAARVVPELAARLRDWFFVNATQFGDGRVRLSGPSGDSVDLAEQALRSALRSGL
jgi:hypothetical protein